MNKKTVYRKDYKPYPYEIISTKLNIDLFDAYALIENTMSIKKLAQEPLVLAGDELELIKVSLDNQNFTDFKLEGMNLVIASSLPDNFTLTITTRIKPQLNTKLSGLYRSQQLFCTQCEAEGFRRITFYPDRPDVLSSFTTKISAPKQGYPYLLSNGNLINKGDLAEDRHFATWHDPFKKPSYLFALVAGELACIEDSFKTMSGRDVKLQIFVEKGEEDKCSHAMNALKNSMRWDEQKFGREYDLDIFMIVAVSDFNMGAMENKGLNIFNSQYILARSQSATDDDFANIEGVVGHEYFHNWTGNRVTCRDWFQLSLKEGLTVFRDQEFSGDMNSAKAIKRIQDVRILKLAQFPEDAGKMSHPVRPESYQEINNFYTATIYNKGAEVIRMQHTLVGDAGFRKGMDLYFARHDGQAVTIDDFVAAIEDANDIDLTQFKLWYSQAGTPQVLINTTFEQATLSLNITQKTHSSMALHIPLKMAIFSADGVMLEEQVLQLTQKEQTFSFKNFNSTSVISMLRDFSAPIKLVFPQSVAQRKTLLKYENNGYARWQAGQSLALENIKLLIENHPQLDIFASFNDVLSDETTDMALRAQILIPPTFQDVAELFASADVQVIFENIDIFNKTLANKLCAKALKLYKELWDNHQENSIAARALRNRCLWLMMKSKLEDASTYCLEQFDKATNMTDTLAAFSLLINTKAAPEVVEKFYNKWQLDKLVMDKWFAIQASSILPGTLENVKKLLCHKGFDIKNPNNVRALVGTFCMRNTRMFHSSDGYKFLSEMLLKLDKLNPQIAARLATPFTRYNFLAPKYQDLIKAELVNLAQHDLSPDLKELVEKSLG